MTPPAASPGTKAAAPRRRLSLRRRLLFSAVLALGCLALLEVAGRVVAAATDRERGVGYDEHLGWHMLPHVEKHGEFWSANEPGRTNSHGWRDRERTPARTAGRPRLAAIGDSFTFGHGVDAGVRFTDRIEAATGWEVLNFGACAYGTDQEVLVYEHEARRFDPDVVVLTAFLGNDLEDIRLDRQSGWSKPYFRLQGDALELVPPVYSWTTALRTNSYLAELLFQVLERSRSPLRRAPEWRDDATDTLPLFAALVRRLRDAVARDDGRLLVMLAQAGDPEAGVQRHGRTDAVVATLTAAGVETLDTLPALAGHADPTALYLDNHHWSAAGHALVAELLLERLRALGWLER